MVEVNLISAKLATVDLDNNIRAPKQLQITGGSSISVAYPPDNTKASGELTAKIFTKDASEMHLNITVQGLFEIKGIEKDEDKKEAHILCYNALFPYAQSYSNQILTASGLPGFFLRKNNLNLNNVTVGNKSLS